MTAHGPGSELLLFVDEAGGVRLPDSWWSSADDPVLAVSTQEGRILVVSATTLWRLVDEMHNQMTGGDDLDSCFMLGGAMTVEPDAAGRIELAAHHRVHLGIDALPAPVRVVVDDDRVVIERS